jgi:hypothetical protein
MDISRAFLEPSNTTHRHYEALRAYFVEGVISAEAAARFGYTTGSFRVLCHQFRQDPSRQFFLPAAKGPKEAPKRDRVRSQVVTLRKQNLSIYDIARALEYRISPPAVSAILTEEGFARLPRRRDEERPPATSPAVAEVADARKLDLSPRSFRTSFGGLFLFVPYLVRIPLQRILGQAGFPGSKMIPAAHAVRSLLGLKLFGHTIPFHGADALVQKHYVSKRSRSQKGILAFVAQDAGNKVFCYANADIRKDCTNDEILVFVKYWKRRTGKVPAELIFDSKLTTQANLDKLNRMHVNFITLRRRSPKMLAEVYAKPKSAWKRIALQGVGRIYRTPRILDQKVELPEYTGSIRQMTIMDLGHEDPTILLTNQLKRSPVKLIERYAKRMIIENNIADAIDFFHMDALSSAVAMKINCDLLLTLMASSLYRLLGCQIGNGYASAKSRHIFRDFISASARVMITKEEIVVRFQKRAHNPLLLAAGFDKTDVAVPWLKRKRLRFLFG